MADDKNKKTPEVKDDETEKRGLTLTIPTTKKQWAAVGSKALGATKKFAGFVTKLGGFVGGVLTLYGAATGIISAVRGDSEEPVIKDVVDDTDGEFVETAAVESDEDIDA